MHAAIVVVILSVSFIKYWPSSSQFESSLRVRGAADLQRALRVRGAADLQRPLRVRGATDLQRPLRVRSATDLQRSMIVENRHSSQSQSGLLVRKKYISDL